MKVILDSNVFCGDYWQRGQQFRVFYSGLSSLPGTLLVPEVVVDEVENRYREELQTHVTQSIKASHTLRQLLPFEPAASAIDVNEHVKQYRMSLEAAITAHGSILPYPKIPHKRIVARDLARRKPFKRDGSGYRDLLIWETARTQMFHGTERVAFITNNLTDFGKGPLVDQELQSDIINPERLLLFTTLKSFNDEFIIPGLAKFEIAKEHAVLEGWGQFELAAWLRVNLIDVISGDDTLGPLVANLPEGVGSTHSTELIAFRKIEPQSTTRLDEDGCLVRVAVTAEMEFDVDISGDDYWRYPEVREFAGSDGNFSWSSTRVVAEIEIELTLLINTATLEVESSEIESIGA